MVISQKRGCSRHHTRITCSSLMKSTITLRMLSRSWSQRHRTSRTKGLWVCSSTSALSPTKSPSNNNRPSRFVSLPIRCPSRLRSTSRHSGKKTLIKEPKCLTSFYSTAAPWSTCHNSLRRCLRKFTASFTLNSSRWLHFGISSRWVTKILKWLLYNKKTITRSFLASNFLCLSQLQRKRTPSLVTPDSTLHHCCTSTLSHSSRYGSLTSREKSCSLCSWNLNTLSDTQV